MMDRSLYSNVASFYDALNGEINYSAWADFIVKILEKYSSVPTKLGLDLGCGTGRMTFALRERGYDMTGVDSSPEMLARAAEVCSRRGIGDILWLCQDMTEFELYGTVDFAVCCLDTFNHLTSVADARRALSLVHNYLVPNGIFIFDLNTPYKFENVYGERDYVLEDEGVLVAWQNFYSKKTKICDFFVSSFTENSDGSYERRDSRQRERCYTLRSIKKLLSDAGFELLFVSSDYSFAPPAENAERYYIAARCIK